MLHCIEHMLDSQQCSRDNKELLVDFMTASSGDFFNIACTEYNDSSDKCNQLKPLPKVSTSSNNKGKLKSAPQINYLTPVFLVIDLLSSLGDGPKL